MFTPTRRFVIIASLVSAGVLAGGTLVLLKGTPAIGWNKDRSKYILPNGWKVSPVGTSLELPGDMPGSVVFTQDGRKAFVNTCGYHDHSISVLNLASKTLAGTLKVPQNWIGMTAVGDDVLVSGGGTRSQSGETKDILRFTAEGGTPKLSGTYSLSSVTQGQRFVSGIIKGSQSLYVLNIQSDEVLKLGLDGKPLAQTKVGYRPYAAALSPDGSVLAVTEWGNESMVLLDAQTLNFRARIKLGSKPSSLAWHKDGRILVTESGSNTLAVIDGSRVTRVTVSLDAATPVGPLPVSVSIAPNGSRAYVALAGDNAVAVLDMTSARPKLIGHIPTERYPSVVACTPDGKQLVIGTAKGFYGPNAGANVQLTGDRIRGKDYNNAFRYIGEQLAGRVHLLSVPTSSDLKAWTEMARSNRPSAGRKSPLSTKAQIAAKANLRKLKHVIFVIRENRTYDQVLGDLPKGNGDPSLTIFGEKVTPNGHSIANQFVTFDNLYCDGETSQGGHQWTTSAHAGDYTEKAWTLGYGRRQQVDSDERLTSSPEYLWSLARKHGHWARVYGEYVDVQEDHNSLNSEVMKKDPEKYGYSEKWEKVFARGGRDTEKISVFLEELKQFETTGKMPSLMVMALPDDHTHGFSAGSHSPYAMVGNNDQALGMLLEAVSKSKFWKDTAVFVIQDDAQAGPDHVDSHRTVGYFASPYTRQGTVDSNHYTTASMLRTMEFILGLPPMTTYDKEAQLMLACVGSKPNLAPFARQEARIDLDEMNPAKTALSERSAKLDFSAYDKADFGELNRILWAGYRKEPYPAHLADE